MRAFVHLRPERARVAAGLVAEDDLIGRRGV
jgi:hypothetical protein